MIMMNNGREKLTAALTLSLVLGTYGITGAAPIDATTTVKKSGTYNSIKVIGESQLFSSLYGIYNAGTTPLAIVMEGDKVIEVNDHGTTIEPDSKTADAVGASGADITGASVHLTVSGQGGQAVGDAAEASASSGASAEGLYNSKVENNAVIKITAVGGTSTASNIATDYATAGATATVKAVNEQSTVGANAMITAIATGGSATAGTNGVKVGSADAYAISYGVNAKSTVGDNAVINVSGTGGKAIGGKVTDTSALADAKASATSYGVKDNSTVGNYSTITVQATGGTAEAGIPAAGNTSSAEALAYASGLMDTSSMGDNGALNVTAVGGTATGSATTSMFANSRVSAYGVINTSTMGDNGVINVTAIGGKSTGRGASSADIDAYGILNKSTVGKTSAITVTATGGTATSGTGYAYANTNAYGMKENNKIGDSSKITIMATGGTATGGMTGGTDAGAKAKTTAYGLEIGNTMGNNSVINVTATGGKATSGKATNAKADAAANADGLNSGDTMGDNGTITVKATGGIAQGGTASESATAHAIAIANGAYWASTVGANNVIEVIAMGGTATGGTGKNADAYGSANAAGVKTFGKVGDNAVIKVTAIGGTATAGTATGGTVAANAPGSAYGVAGSKVGANATIIAIATGGTTAGTNAYASAFAQAYGVNDSTVGANAVIEATATGGTAASDVNTANVSAVAYGLEIGSTAGDNVVIKATAIGGTASLAKPNASAKAYGLSAVSRTNTLQGAAVIKTAASVNTPGAKFSAYSLYAEGMENGANPFYSTNNVAATGKTKILEGDVYAASYGINNLVLDTEDSYLQGNIVSTQKTAALPFGVNNVTISNGAIWRPVYDNRYGTDCNTDDSVLDTTKNVAANTVDTRTVTGLTLQEDGTVDLAWDGDRSTYRTLNIGALSGNEGEFIIKTDLNSETNGDKINITTGEAGSTQYIAVDDASLNTGRAVTGTKKLLVATDASGSYKFVGEQLDTGGLWQTEATIENLDGNNWYLTAVNASPNGIANSLIGTVESGYGMWRNTLTDDTLRKRLGDLRYGDEEVSSVWARVKAGKLSADTYEGSYQMYQVGVDKKKGNTAYGLAIDYGRSSNDLASGTTDGSNTGLSLYATTYHDNGVYNDIVFRAGRLGNEMKIGGAYQADSMDYKAWGYSLGYEIGKTFRKDNGWYVEPQAQLVYGYLKGGDETTDRGFNVNRDNINSFIGRLGFALGRRINKSSDYYFKANVYHEFAGGGDTHLSYGSQNMYYDGDHKDTWFEMGIGTNVKLSKNTHFYGDVLKTFGGDIHKKWQINAGVRWTWGGAK